MNIADRTINALQHRSQAYQQSENALLDYTVNYASLLNTDTITTSTWSSSQNGATIVSTSNTTTTATAKISATPGKYRIINKIVTANGLTDERIIILDIPSNDDLSTEDYQ